VRARLDEKREAVRAYHREYYRRNQQACLAGLHRRRAANPGRQEQYNKKWILAHPEYAREANNRRRARLAGAVSTMTAVHWKETLEYFGQACAYCLRTDRPLTQEHMQPISKGGPHTRENVVPACGSCNSRKHDRGVLAMVNAREF
jgi:5-methylcytosine-specific restriction endonuclease McrA